MLETGFALTAVNLPCLSSLRSSSTAERIRRSFQSLKSSLSSRAGRNAWGNITDQDGDNKSDTNQGLNQYSSDIELTSRK